MSSKTNDQDYTKLSLAELLNAEKKIKRGETISRFIIGFLVGVMIFGVANQGFGFLYIFIPLLLISGVYKNSRDQHKKLTQIQAAIDLHELK